jgi:4-hydroxy-tetrahydrodipicolinate reductase
VSDLRPGMVLLGAGRMGRLVHEGAFDAGFELLGVAARHRPDWLAPSLWRAGLEDLPGTASLLVDFSLPDGTSDAAAWCAGHGVALLSGTTGLDASQDMALARAAQSVPVLWAANFSIGVNLCLDLVGQIAGRLGGVRELRITDIHHAGKKDAPSGTALALGAATAPLQPRYTSVREGEAVGEHRVCFTLAGEELEIVHRSLDRGIYARGALEAGHWLLQQPPGRYTVDDWMAG